MKKVLFLLISVLVFSSCEQKKILIESEDGRQVVAVATSRIPAVGATITVMKNRNFKTSNRYVYNGTDWEGRENDDFLGLVPVKRDILKGKVLAVR